MDIGDLHDPQSFQIPGQIGDGDGYFGNPETVAAHNPKGRGRQRRDAKAGCPRLAEVSAARDRIASLCARPDSASDNPINHMVSTSEAHSSQVHHCDGKVPQHPLEFQQVTSHEQSRGSGRAQPDQTAAAGRIQQPADDRRLQAEAENKQAEARKEVHTQKHCYHSMGASGLLRFAARMLHWCCNSRREIPGRLMVGQRPLEP